MSHPVIPTAPVSTALRRCLTNEEFYCRKSKVEQTPPITKRPVRARRGGSPVSEPEGPGESSPDGDDEGGRIARKKAVGRPPKVNKRASSSSATRKQEAATPSSELSFHS